MNLLTGSRLILFVSISFFGASCKRQAPLFTLLNAEKTGIGFQNDLPENDTSLDILDYLYYYNGGGVATGDINNDGLPDIYFTSNRGSNKLYLNKGNLAFEDITEKAGLKGKADWKTGVTAADVNGDGLLDLYVSVVGNFAGLKGSNELYINNGDLSFTESAELYGLDVTAFSSQATFFDYDKDGDLDMFLVCHSIHSVATYMKANERKPDSRESGSKLFMNEQKEGRTHFREVTHEAGILNFATYGLNVIVGDFNNDNWDDIYVSNDFYDNDYYYLNNGDGSFSEKNKTAFGHESRFSMGSDVADINNDGWLDLITLDMLPKDEKILKASASDDEFDVYNFKLTYGYHAQLARNCLQLNVGAGNFFSEIGLFSGIGATDWSWCPLAADFDNDGQKDLFITNGIVRRPNDLDYIKFVSNPSLMQSLTKGKTADKIAIDKMPAGKTANFMYQGKRDLKFQDRSVDWGFEKPTLSNGSAYADLDNDGDLDIVINNINEPAMIYRNNSRQQNKLNFLDVQLKGTGHNLHAYGAKVIIKYKDTLQLNYVTGSRGFLSASTNIVHFGLDQDTKVDTLQVIWPSGKIQQLTGIAVNQRLIIEEAKAGLQVQTSLLPSGQMDSSSFLLNDVTRETGVDWKHRENVFIDFNVQALIPHMISIQGPKVAVADINNDGLDDFFVCGAHDQASALFVQNKEGRFESREQAVFEKDSASEDVNALFFDANGDGFQDLYVACGGNEFWGNKNVLQDRLYINNGKGGFAKSNGLPLFYGNNSVAVSADFDRDGDADLFVGGRVIARNYGNVPTSFLLINNGKGDFSIANDSMAPGLSKIGMVTDATWTDITMDGWPDLAIVGEWMPVVLFTNNKGRLENNTKSLGLDKATGLWQSIKASDVDKNGFPDLLVGNWGQNSKLTATQKYPLKLYVGDIDHNGDADQLLSIAKEGRYYSFANKEELEKQFPAMIRKRYEYFHQMAGQTLDEIFPTQLQHMNELSVNTLSTVVLWNNGEEYHMEELPGPLQWFPVFAWVVADLDADGANDIVAAGNFYGVTPYEGRYDAGYGQLIMKKKNNWITPLPCNTGLKLSGDIRSVERLRTTGNRLLYLVARNNDKLMILEATKKL